MGDFKWFLIAILVLFVLWVLTIDTEVVYENRGRPFLEQPAPIETGQPYSLEELKDRTRP